VSAPVLGVPLMDRDHAALDGLFARVAQTPDAGLLYCFDSIALALGEHFAREEAAMTEARVPILLCHLELHAQLLREVEKMREALATCDAGAARALIGTILPDLVANHIATADTVSALFLRR
jgi:hemerythrin-like metal-binding protein